MTKLTDAEKANLSEEELAAVEGEEDSSDDLEEIANMKDGDEADGDDTEDEEDADDSDEADDAGASKEADANNDSKVDAESKEIAAKSEAKEKASAAEEIEVVEDEDKGQDFVPRMIAKDVSDFESKIKEISIAKNALSEQFENGELKHSEYMGKRDDLVAQETELRVKKANADFVAEQNESTSKQRWEWEQDRFFEENEIYLKDPLLHAALDAAVKSLAVAKDDSGKLVNNGKSLAWFLKEGHGQVSARFNIGKADTSAADDNKAEEQKANPDEKPKKTRAGTKPDLKSVPKTIGNLPAAADSEVGESEYDRLDKLTGMDYEDALARLPADKQKAYLAR